MPLGSRIAVKTADLFHSCQGQGFIDGAGFEENGTALGAKHALLDSGVEPGEERVVEAGDVDEDDGFAMEVEGLPGEDLEHLFHGAEAAGKDEEGVGALAHEGFAGVHGGGDVELGEALVGDLLINQDEGNDADDDAAGGEAGVCHGAHKADLGAAVDKADAATGEGSAEIFGGLLINSG